MAVSILLVGWLMVGCATPRAPEMEPEAQPQHPNVHALQSATHRYVRMDETVSSDAQIASHLAPYSNELDGIMNQFVTISKGVMPIDQPESALGNLTADILRQQATAEFGQEVHIAIMNRGGLRIPIPKGDITVRTLFELMPFENYITLLRFSGEQIQELAHELADEGGEPVSGMRMRIENKRAVDLTVGGEPVDPQGTYWLATNIWMANGGGTLPTLWEPQERIDTPVLIRESFIEYLKQKEFIEPMLDGRLTE